MKQSQNTLISDAVCTLTFDSDRSAGREIFHGADGLGRLRRLGISGGVGGSRVIAQPLSMVLTLLVLEFKFVSKQPVARHNEVYK